jgi:hypothetical protein
MDEAQQAVTMWYRFDKERRGYTHNHLEDGHSMMDRPVDKLGLGRWQRGQWEKRHGFLVPGGFMGAMRLQLNEVAPVLAGTRDD